MKEVNDYVSDAAGSSVRGCLYSIIDLRCEGDILSRPAVPATDLRIIVDRKYPHILRTVADAVTGILTTKRKSYDNKSPNSNRKTSMKSIKTTEGTPIRKLVRNIGSTGVFMVSYQDLAKIQQLVGSYASRAGTKSTCESYPIVVNKAEVKYVVFITISEKGVSR